ncbi:hypothetical protein DMN91_008639 [Ooceraea biroi]|uniref:Uncharacterized protein n=1 Tax=Ooceraea biroi TaxID=2015173 RepID=A0A3L8DDQ9_OOCBI|nr:uncharacterized protein LOC105279072 [Ooceraea biroi]RLU18283.1 hypothetical protein DMN91_008639 [Ooceraea biroi]
MRRRVPISSACMEPTDCRLMTTSIAATVAAAPQPSQPRNGTACEDCEATMNQKPVTGMDTLHCHGNPPPSRFPLVIVPSGVVRRDFRNLGLPGARSCHLPVAGRRGSRRSCSLFISEHLFGHTRKKRSAISGYSPISPTNWHQPPMETFARPNVVALPLSLRYHRYHD